MPSIFKKGDILGERVRLVELFCSGGQAEIWCVEDLEYPEHKDIALKVRYVPWDQRSDPEFRVRDERLVEEVKVLGECREPYIVTPHFKIGGQHDAEGELYAYYGLGMDFAPDGSLDRFLSSDEFGAYLPIEKVKLLIQMALGVQALQHRKIVHNDIKPQNILVFRASGAPHLRFADFGYSFRRGEKVVLGGTPIYMAPELVLRESEPSFRTDMFSLGLVFYETMMGFHPLVEVVRNREPLKALKGFYSTDEYIAFTDQQHQTAKPLVDLIQRMCSRDSTRRPSIVEVLEELDEIIKSDPSWNSINLEKYYPELVDRYRWADSLHHLFAEKELLIFLRVSNRETDPNILSEWLKAEKLFGFTIMRLTGEYDLLLRIWRRPTDKAALDTVLKRFEAERGACMVFEPEYHWPLSPSADKLGLRQHVNGLALLDDFAKNQPKRHPAIVGLTKVRREEGKNSNAIRAICRAVATKQLPRDLAEVIGEKIYARLAKSRQRPFSMVEVFVDTGSRGKMAEFLIIAESQQFHKFPHMLDALETILKTLSDAPLSRTVTHFELDKASPAESYDGRLIYELFRYNRTRQHES